MKKTSIFFTITITSILLLVSCGKSIEKRYVEEATKTLSFHKNLADSLSSKWNEEDLNWRLAHKDLKSEVKRHDMCAFYLQKALSGVSEKTPFDSIEKKVNNLVVELNKNKQVLEKEIKEGEDFLNSDEYLKSTVDFSNFTDALFETKMELLNIETTIDALESGISRAKNPK